MPWQAEATPSHDVTNTHEISLDGTSLTLGWSNPRSTDGSGNTIYENIDFQGVMIRYSTGAAASYPLAHNEGTLFGDKTGSLGQDDSFTGTITVGQIYKFSFFTHDYSGNHSSTAHLTIDTSGTSSNHAPVINSFSVYPQA